MPRKLPEIKADRFKPGMRSIPARQLNALVDAANPPGIGVNPPRQPKYHGKGGGSAVIILYLVSVEDDYLVCEDADENVFNVAKPFELRRTPFDGLTVNGVTYTYVSAIEREGDDGVTVETQHITPNYIAGHEIYAVTPQGGAGLTAVDYSDITLLEMDQGRAWAAEEAGTA